jgi:hypothetical protein
MKCKNLVNFNNLDIMKNYKLCTYFDSENKYLGILKGTKEIIKKNINSYKLDISTLIFLKNLK